MNDLNSRAEFALAEMQDWLAEYGGSNPHRIRHKFNDIAEAHSLSIAGMGHDDSAITVELQSLRPDVVSIHISTTIEPEDLPMRRLKRILQAEHGDSLGLFIANRVALMLKAAGLEDCHRVYIARSDSYTSMEAYNTCIEGKQVLSSTHLFERNGLPITVSISILPKETK
jgi:hypothetical protein